MFCTHKNKQTNRQNPNSMCASQRIHKFRPSFWKVVRPSAGRGNPGRRCGLANAPLMNESSCSESGLATQIRLVRAVVRGLIFFPLHNASAKAKRGQRLGGRCAARLPAARSPRPSSPADDPRPQQGSSCYWFLTLARETGVGPSLLSRAPRGRR